MSLASEVSADGETLTIIISGEFDAAVNAEFRNLLRRYQVGQYIVDLKNAEGIDSAALGMLLILREQAISSSSAVIIINSSRYLKRVLSIAKFDHLFSIQ